MREETYKNFLLKFGYFAVIAGIVFVILKYLFPYLTPFIIAFIVASLIYPLARFISRKLKIKRGPLAVILVLLAYVVMTGLLTLLFAKLITQLIVWGSYLPNYFSVSIAPAISDLGNKLTAQASRFDPAFVRAIGDLFPNIIDSIKDVVTKFSYSAVNWAKDVAVGLPGTMLSAVICVIASVFLAAEYDKIIAAIKGHLPDRAVNIVNSAEGSLKTILKNYAKSYLLILCITFTEITIGLFIIGYKKAALIAVIIALFDILPIVGSGMIFLPWTIILFLQGQTGRGLAVGILYVIVVVARQVIEPKIVGKKVGLHPLLALLCMWVGAKLLGVIGLFGLPITLLIIKELKENGVILRNERKEKQES